MSELGADPTTETPTLLALSTAVGRFGPEVGSDPRRVQASVNDLLGAEARAHRAEVDALVIAAEELVPTALTAGDADREELQERLQARGLSPVSAEFAIAVWSAALGVNGLSDVIVGLPALTTLGISEPASDTSDPIPAPGQGQPDLVGPTVTRGGMNPQPVVLPAPIVVEREEPAVAHADELQVLGETAAPRRKRALAVMGGACVLVVAVIAGLALISGGTDDKSDKVRAEVRDPDPVASLELDVETAAWGAEVSRTWEVQRGTFSSAVTVKNTTDAPITGRHVEVIPKSLAESVDDLAFTPKPDEVIQKDPVVAWDLRLEPDESTTISYEVLGVDKDAGVAELKAWSKDRNDTIAQFKKLLAEASKDTTPPPVNLLYPGADTTVGDASVAVTGFTEAGAKLVVNGTPATVNADGGFMAQISLVPGPNKISVSAKDAAGNENLVEISVSYVAGSSTDPNPGLDGSGDSGGTGGSGTGGSDSSGGGGGTTTPPCTDCGQTVPDSDGDGFKDDSDRCRTERGISAHGGCPAPTLTIYGDAYVCPYPNSHNYEVGWTGSLSPTSYQWYADNGTQFSGGKKVEGIYFPNPNDVQYLSVAVVFDGVRYTTRVEITTSGPC